MYKKVPTPLLGRMLKKIAPRIGAKVIIEPEWNIAGQVVFKSGRKRYFRYSSLDLNTLGSSEVSKDKDFAKFFMRRMGYPTVPGKTFFSDIFCNDFNSKKNIHAAYAYAQKIHFPVMVKPNSGSQGIGVCKVHAKREFYKAMHFIFARDRVALVEKVMEGKDYRVVVLDDKVISAYERVPLSVVGDGKSTIQQLLRKKQSDFIKEGRDTRIKFEDFRITQKLSHQKLSMNSIIKRDQQIFLLDNANLSSGGDSMDVTESMHQDFKKIAIGLTKDMGLKMCGVDMLVVGDIKQKPKKYCILEINSAPGLDHYFLSGKKQEKIVEDMYLKVLKAME